MRQEEIEITAEGQSGGPVMLHGYLLDAVSVAEEKKRPAVIVCAGGGYHRRSDREAEPVALQFMAMGYHAFILDYSVAPSRFPVSLLELAEAVAQVRAHSAAWNLDPRRIVVCGFSAAGHLACSLGVYWNQRFVYEALGRESREVRPDGLILCYPVITSGEHAHEGSFLQLLGEGASPEERERVSLERWVTYAMPKAFIWHTLTDETVPVENSLLLAEAMRARGVSFELHIYPSGGHGLSLATEETGGHEERLINAQCQSWIRLVKTWMEHEI